MGLFEDLEQPSRQGTFMLAIASFILVIVMILVAIRPAIASVIRQISSNDKRRELIEAQNTKITGLRNIIRQKDEYATEIKIFYEIYPKVEDAEFLVQNIHEYDLENDDFELKSIKMEYPNIFALSNSKDLNGVYKLETNIMYNCDLEQAVKFTEFLEGFPRIFNIKEVSYTSAEEGEDTLLPLAANIKVEVYSKQGLNNNI